MQAEIVENSEIGGRKGVFADRLSLNREKDAVVLAIASGKPFIGRGPADCDVCPPKP